MRALILDGTATAAHDLSDGGLAVALAEMAMASGIGAKLDDAPDDIPAHAYWFGEDQARYLVTVPAAKAKAVLERARAASVLVSPIGTTGGDALTLAGRAPASCRQAARDVRSLAAGLYGGRTDLVLTAVAFSSVARHGGDSAGRCAARQAMRRPPPRLIEGQTASRSARQWRAIASRFGSGNASIFSSGIGGGATAAGGGGGAGCGSSAFFLPRHAWPAASSRFGAAPPRGQCSGGWWGGGGAAAAGGGGGGAALTAGGGGGGAAAAGGGDTALTALPQAGDSLAMCCRRQSSASLPPRGTPEQFDKKSERQDERMALNCSSLGFCACAGDPEADDRSRDQGRDRAAFRLKDADHLSRPFSRIVMRQQNTKTDAARHCGTPPPAVSSTPG